MIGKSSVIAWFPMVSPNLPISQQSNGFPKPPYLPAVKWFLQTSLSPSSQMVSPNLTISQQSNGFPKSTYLPAVNIFPNLCVTPAVNISTNLPMSPQQ